LTREFTYAGAGVDRGLRAGAKVALRFLQRTYGFSCYGGVVRFPYGILLPFREGCYLDFVIEVLALKFWLLS